MVGGGQFLDFGADSRGWMAELASVSQGMRTSGFLNGCVLTFVSGDLQNMSTRTVGYTMDTTQSPRWRFRVLVANRDDLAFVLSAIFNEFESTGERSSERVRDTKGIRRICLDLWSMVRRERCQSALIFPQPCFPIAGEPLG